MESADYEALAKELFAVQWKVREWHHAEKEEQDEYVAMARLAYDRGVASCAIHAPDIIEARRGGVTNVDCRAYDERATDPLCAMRCEQHGSAVPCCHCASIVARST